jgi:hypothetical protein
MSDTSDKRGDPRRRVLKSGRIVFNQRASSLNCTVRNLSAGGALLEFDGPLGIPDSFELRLGDGTARQCTVVRRHGREIGVEFDPDWPPPPRRKRPPVEPD